MKTIKILGIATAFIITSLSLAAFIGLDETSVSKATAKVDGKGFAVVELFTSEGCSSCPPADELLAKIQKEAQGKYVYLLAYHVDYWNRQGWKDVFSSSDFSNRQIQYGRLLGAQVYTPQAIVNGKTEFVGSDEPALRRAINEGLTTQAKTTLTLQANQDGDRLKVQYQATGAIKGNSLVLALVQKSAQSQVERGENAGRTLSHVQIVRKLESDPLNTGTGTNTISLPKGYNAQGWEVLGLVQNQTSGEILAAAKAGLNTNTTK